jgi:hypothetical protein
MRFIKTKKGAALVVTLVVVAASAIGAYAYLTAGGSGSGSATGGSATNNLVIGTGVNAGSPVSVGDGVTPGNSAAVSFEIYNPNSFAVHVTSVSQSGAISNTNSGTNAYPAPGSCDPSWFSYANGGGTPFTAQTIAAGATAGPFTGSISETESGTNQDGCEAKTLTLTLASA